LGVWEFQSFRVLGSWGMEGLLRVVFAGLRIFAAVIGLSGSPGCHAWPGSLQGVFYSHVPSVAAGSSGIHLTEQTEGTGSVRTEAVEPRKSGERPTATELPQENTRSTKTGLCRPLPCDLCVPLRQKRFARFAVILWDSSTEWHGKGRALRAV
jgi:hypothetical protein